MGRGPLFQSLGISSAVKIFYRGRHPSEFDQIEYIAFLFALRVPPGALSIVRAYNGGELAARAH